MNPIEGHVAWFVGGVVVGWLLHWLGSRARSARALPTHQSEPGVSASIPGTTDEKRPDRPAYHEPASSRVIDVGAARSAGFNIKHADDLTVIEGIGPKADDLLRANGVGSFAQLARLDSIDILEILERGGPNFRLTDPATWAEQASLAAENRWPELKRMQNEMNLGSTPEADS